MPCVYCFRVGTQQRFKVGHTKQPTDRRRKGLSTGSPEKLTLHKKLESEHARPIEKYVHWLLDARRAPNGEFFDVDEEQLAKAMAEAETFVGNLAPLKQEALKLARIRPFGKLKQPTAPVLQLYCELREAERQKFFLEQRILFLQSQLKIEIGESPGVVGVALWRWREQWKLDEKRLKKEQPKIFERYKRLSSARVFCLQHGRPEPTVEDEEETTPDA